MVFQTCPTDVLRSPAERIWRLLTRRDELERWLDAKLVEFPARDVLAAGDRLALVAGPAQLFHVTFNVLELEPPRRLRLDVLLPFGVRSEEDLRMTPLGPQQTRVTFN